jgi:hypothetical protein
LLPQPSSGFLALNPFELGAMSRLESFELLHSGWGEREPESNRQLRMRIT